MRTAPAMTILLLAFLIGPAITHAPAATPLKTELVTSGLTRPVYVTAPPGDTDRLFIVEQRDGTTGRIQILDLASGTLNVTPFLSVPNVSTGSEQGLLGLAFHPDYAQSGWFFVNFTDAGGDTHLRRYQVSADPDIADPNSAVDLLLISQPYSNHNGGWIGFGPDGYLYMASGDGGSGGDPGNNAQDITNNLLGKILRLDVDGGGGSYAIPPGNPFVGVSGDDEIWAYGLRNPWRCSFDRETSDFYIADVGQNAWEEVDFQPAASMGGENYGWRCYEGNNAFNTSGCPDPNTLVFPIHEYSHSLGCSITGGYVYRGFEICDLRGTYFFADFCSDRIWSFRYDAGSVVDFQERTAELDPNSGPAIGSIVSFGEDARGELYIVSLGGNIFRITRDGPQKGDLNNDGVIDFNDINPFVVALTAPTDYQAQYGLAPEVAGDLDCSGAADFGDINPFVVLLTTP